MQGEGAHQLISTYSGGNIRATNIADVFDSSLAAAGCGLLADDAHLPVAYLMRQWIFTCWNLLGGHFLVSVGEEQGCN